MIDPIDLFHSPAYLRHNARRLEHLASLRLPVAGLSVLEVGAGIGDHSHYYIDRGCPITITEAREENLFYLIQRYPDHDVQYLDLETLTEISSGPFDLVHCYGLLYHLSAPQKALSFLSQQTKKILLLETCVSFDEDTTVNLIAETQVSPTQSYSGTGCRPTRPWLFHELQQLFAYVYLPKTQPRHEEFPLDWTAPEKHKASFQRAIFIASRHPLDNPMLAPSLLHHQIWHE